MASQTPFGFPAQKDGLSGDHRQSPQDSRGTFPILSRDPSFQETMKKPGETDGF